MFRRLMDAFSKISDGIMKEGNVIHENGGSINGKGVTILGIDASESMDESVSESERRIDLCKEAAIEYVKKSESINSLNILGVVAFNSESRIITSPMQLNNGKSIIIESISKIEAWNGTSLHSALVMANRLMKSIRCQNKTIILLSDGWGGKPIAYATSLKKEGIVIKTIGIANDEEEVDSETLKLIASKTNGEVQYRFIKDFNKKELIEHFRSLATGIAK